MSRTAAPQKPEETDADYATRLATNEKLRVRAKAKREAKAKAEDARHTGEVLDFAKQINEEQRRAGQDAEPVRLMAPLQTVSDQDGYISVAVSNGQYAHAEPELVSVGGGSSGPYPVSLPSFLQANPWAQQRIAFEARGAALGLTRDEGEVWEDFVARVVLREYHDSQWGTPVPETVSFGTADPGEVPVSEEQATRDVAELLAWSNAQSLDQARQYITALRAEVESLRTEVESLLANVDAQTKELERGTKYEHARITDNLQFIPPNASYLQATHRRRAAGPWVPIADPVDTD